MDDVLFCEGKECLPKMSGEVKYGRLGVGLVKLLQAGCKPLQEMTLLSGNVCRGMNRGPACTAADVEGLA